MAYIPIAADKTNNTVSDTDHPEHHNQLAEEINWLYANHAINLLKYGNDEAAAQAAIDDAAASGRALYAPGDLYEWATPVTVPDFLPIFGDGDQTVIRATNDNTLFNMNGNRCGVFNLTVDSNADGTDSTGFDFTNTGSNVTLEGIYFGNNLQYGIYLAPDSSSACFWLRRLRWNGVTNGTDAITIGGGGALVTDVYMSDCIGTASTNTDMSKWLAIPSDADTVKVRSSLFIKGARGLYAGETSQITNLKFSDFTVDQMTNIGIHTQFVRECAFSGCEISTCGAANVASYEIGANSKGVRFVNGVIQNGGGYGVILRSGAVHTKIANSVITDNNTTNTSNNDGIAVAAGASKFQIHGNTVGNSVLLSSGHQKIGISVASGASDNYSIIGNHCEGNETSNNVIDNGTGVNKIVANNTPPAAPTTASAATVTLPSYSDTHVISGTTNITSITASWANRLITLRFTGVLTFTDGSNLVLAGNFTTANNATITLRCDGTNWIEVARSTN